MNEYNWVDKRANQLESVWLCESIHVIMRLEWMQQYIEEFKESKKEIC